MHNGETAKRQQMAACRIPPSITVTSSFAPKEWKCSECDVKNSLDYTTCSGPICSGRFRRPGVLFDHRGEAANPARFPVHWMCSTCDRVHSVLDILTKRVICACGHPILQAVYDQFGDLFLFWRDDPAIHDLRDPDMVQEAAWRLWEAGSAPWLPEMAKSDKEGAGHLDKLKGLRLDMQFYYCIAFNISYYFIDVSKD